jgi:uncharacterized protein (TIGR02145 family)
MIIYKAKPASTPYYDWETEDNIRTQCDTFDYAGVHLQDRKITASILSATPIAFEIGDYFLYDTPYDNERFTLQSAPVVTRVYNSLMLSYALTFWWAGYELRLINFLDVVTGEDATFYYSSNANVVLRVNAQGLANRLKYNCDRAGYADWNFNLDASVDLTIKKDIVTENLTCWEVVGLFKTEFNLDFRFSSDIRTVIIGSSPEVVEGGGASGGYIFEFGKDKGLCEINRLANDQKIITRVYGYGSTQNIPADYRTGENHSYQPRLMLPLSAAPYGYIQDDALVAQYGIREAQYVNDNIYPTLGVAALIGVDPILDRPLTAPAPQYKETVITPAYKELVITEVYNEITHVYDKVFTNIEHPAVIKRELIPTVNSVDYSLFSVYIDNPGFNPFDENIRTESDPLIAFTSGQLEGSQFKIKTCQHDYIADEWGVISEYLDSYFLVLERQVDANGYVTPNSIVKPAAGDTYTFVNINMPDTYIPDAEARLLADTQQWFESQKQSPEGYSIQIPEEFVVRVEGIEAGLRESNAVRFRDTLLGIGTASPYYVLIQSITISHKADKLLPTYDLTISESPIKGFLGQMDVRLKSVARSVAINQVTAQAQQANNLKSGAILNQTIFNNNGDIDGRTIAPGSILPSALSPELRQTAYILQAFFQVNYMGDANSAYGSSGTITHADADITWGGAFNLEHQTWTIAAPQTFTLDPLKYYFVYVKCNRTTGTAIWVVSEVPIPCESIEGFYHFEWGVVLPVRDGVRYAQGEHGENGVSSYIYLAYASSDAGADFTLTDDGLLPYMSIITAASEIESPAAGDFAGHWFRRIGENGGGSFPATITSTTTNSDDGTTHTHELGNILLDKVVEGTPVELGALYNHYVVSDARNICSEGWHISLNAGFITFITSLGGYNQAGKIKMVSDVYWNTPNIGATNESKFNARGSGFRSWNGLFLERMNWFGMWAADVTEYGDGVAYYQHAQVDIDTFVAEGSNLDSLTTGLSLRPVKDSTTLTHGQTGTYTGNDGKVYPTICIYGIEILDCNLSETKFRNGDWIHGFDGGVYTPISNAAWEALTSEGMCYFEDNEAYGGGLTPLTEMLHLPVTIHPNSTDKLSINGNQELQFIDNSYILDVDFQVMDAFEFTCPSNMKFTTLESEYTDPTLSVALNTDMAKYDDLTITPTALGLVTLTAILL